MKRKRLLCMSSCAMVLFMITYTIGTRHHYLHFLHAGAKRFIFRCDIKPSNILLDSNMMPTLSDFGLSLQGPLSTSKPKPIAVDYVADMITQPRQY
ncbi:hypothetical protein Ahy_A04g017497 [Arachis hypogaea]|uniref:Protein kinase domain-containing protein n=1 Tax=Arachis hypogaea TaxID=3818 RepID=A0A445DB87_ARAHY|nr:hypothetical protein Ahy_A04g017497 [Arachis hypogaea]